MESPSHMTSEGTEQNYFYGPIPSCLYLDFFPRQNQVDKMGLGVFSLHQHNGISQHYHPKKVLQINMSSSTEASCSARRNTRREQRVNPSPTKLQSPSGTGVLLKCEPPEIISSRYSAVRFCSKSQKIKGISDLKGHLIQSKPPRFKSWLCNLLSCVTLGK